ncbi:hypothetical protein BX070DRAFT_226645 [Coemansia spiralis]|nr:hypothetical protein BX070DRAFT_226645 [Coemansia spiralis]
MPRKNTIWRCCCTSCATWNTRARTSCRFWSKSTQWTRQKSTCRALTRRWAWCSRSSGLQRARWTRSSSCWTSKK